MFLFLYHASIADIQILFIVPANCYALLMIFFFYCIDLFHFQYYLTIPYVCLCRYISALIDDGEQASLQQAVDRGWPASLHLIGKVCSKRFL